MSSAKQQRLSLSIASDGQCSHSELSKQVQLMSQWALYKLNTLTYRLTSVIILLPNSTSISQAWHLPYHNHSCPSDKHCGYWTQNYQTELQPGKQSANSRKRDSRNRKNQTLSPNRKVTETHQILHKILAQWNFEVKSTSFKHTNSTEWNKNLPVTEEFKQWTQIQSNDSWET